MKRPTGIPDKIADARRLRLDFLPYEERTVQREGIVWDKIWYRDPLLAQWVRETEAGRPRKFKVRRDPTDISKLYFFDPNLKTYVEIPYRDYGRPSISLWEYRAAEAWLRQQGKAAEDESAIFAAFEEMHRITDEATRETKRVRRQKAKRDELRRHRAELTLDPPGITAKPPKEKPQTEPVGPPAAKRGRRSHLSLVIDNPGSTPPPKPASDGFDFSTDEIAQGYETW